MIVGIVLMSLGAIALVFYLLEKCKGYTLKGVLLKTAVSLLFVATAIIAAYNSSNKLNAFIISGLVLGLLGDIFLDLKYVYPKDDKLYTYAGFIVFGIGHIVYVTGMMLQFYGDSNLLYYLIPIGGALVFVALNLILEKPLKLKFGNYKLIVSLYAFLLALNPLTSLLICINTSWSLTTPIMMFVGGVSFAISDLVLSNTYFGEGHEKPIDFILNYLTYYGAQFIIAFSLFFVV